MFRFSEEFARAVLPGLHNAENGAVQTDAPGDILALGAVLGVHMAQGREGEAMKIAAARFPRNHRLPGHAARVTRHSFRQSFATHLVKDSSDIGTVQELLGHEDVKTTMVLHSCSEPRARRYTEPNRLALSRVWSGVIWGSHIHC